MATNYALGNILTGIEAGIAKMGKTPDTVTSSDLGMADRECTCSATPHAPRRRPRVWLHRQRHRPDRGVCHCGQHTVRVARRELGRQGQL
jgi:hypothetical protein